jgi:hypothetical protein
VQNETPTGVHFTPGKTGSSLFHDALEAATGQHSEVFSGIVLPRGKKFKAELADVLVRFEARRAGSAARVDVARTLAASVASHTRFGPSSAPLADSLAEGPCDAQVHKGTGEVGWVPEITYKGKTWSGKAIGDLAQRMRDDHQLTDAAARALTWTADELLGQPVDLQGHSFALLGAGAELAPTPYLLQAGARVLWVDRRAPSPSDAAAGTLVHAPDAGDLLADPAAVYRAVLAEARHAPVHIGLYAYAPGKGRELLLAASMNAIAARIDDASLNSLSMLISPTTPGELAEDGRAEQRARREASSRWQRGITRVGLLGRSPSHRDGDAEIARSIVALQGPTYLAAQYLAKMMLSEAWAVDRPSVRVSANVAGITHTKSLEHPLFLAGFVGAPAFGIEVFTPDQTRVLTTLMMLHDVLNPAAPGADRSGTEADHGRRVASQAIHGGVRTVPWDFWRVIQLAAVIGLTKRPGLMIGR